MIRGYVDKVTNSRTIGWAYNNLDKNERLLIIALYNGEEISISKADLFRNDLTVISKDANYAFTLDYYPIEDISKVSIIAMTKKGRIKILNP